MTKDKVSYPDMFPKAFEINLVGAEPFEVDFVFTTSVRLFDSDETEFEYDQSAVDFARGVSDKSMSALTVFHADGTCEVLSVKEWREREDL